MQVGKKKGVKKIYEKSAERFKACSLPRAGLAHYLSGLTREVVVSIVVPRDTLLVDLGDIMLSNNRMSCRGFSKL